MSADKYFARFPRLLHIELKKWTQLHKICGLSIHPFGFTKSNGEFYKAVIPVVLFGFAMNRTSSGVTRLVRSLSTRVQFGLSNNFYINKNVSKKKLSFNFQWGILGLPQETFIIPVRSGRSSWSEKVFNAQSVKELYKRQHQYSVCPYPVFLGVVN